VRRRCKTVSFSLLWWVIKQALNPLDRASAVIELPKFVETIALFLDRLTPLSGSTAHIAILSWVEKTNLSRLQQNAGALHASCETAYEGRT